MLLNMLENLCRVPAPPGREHNLCALLANMLEKHAHRLERDISGNLQAWLNPMARPVLMLDAHMDEVGIMVRHIEDNGCLRIVPMGGLEAALLPGSKVLMQLGNEHYLDGIIGLAPPHVSGGKDKGAASWDEIYLDIGAANKDEAFALGVEIGMCGVLDAGQGRLGHDSFYARNLDNRVGCALLVWLMEELADAPPPFSICFNFSVAEEVGLRGATTAAYHIQPDLALVLEATVGDTPGLPVFRQPSFMGQGPAITVMDGRQIVPLPLVESLEAAAGAAGIQCQRKRPPTGGTDGGAISLSRAGVPTAVLSVPARYIHSPVSCLRISDLQAAGRLLREWVLRYCPWPTEKSPVRARKL